MAADKKIFADLTDNDIGKCIEEKDAANTKRSTDNSVRLFRKYLLEKGKGADFESMEISELEANLSRFYAEARSEQGTLYKKSSLQTIRHGLSRHLTNTKGIDIIRGLEFKNSNKVFLAVSKDLKRQGFGGMEHYPPLEEADLRKMYAQFDLTDPKQLQWRVFCDVMIYFGRRGRENLRDLKITDFACKRDGEGKMFIYLVKDEVTKNHQNDPNTASGRMYELQDGDDLCPVRTFVRYKRKLNPKCVFLFQRPSSNPKADVWYDNCPVGANKLGAIMSTISAEFGLSKSYTNHSLRATLVHILDAANFAGRHIMSVTGHKSETSFKTYTGYTDAGTKERMSKVLSESTRPTPRYSESTSTSSCTFTGSATASNTDVPLIDFPSDSDFGLEPLSDSQINQLLCDMCDDSCTGPQPIAAKENVKPNTTNQMPVQSQSQVQTFQNVSYNLGYPPMPSITNHGTININFYQVSKK
ncbi:hypothetical protein FSP39_017185 [Pinctada imbricata]|uniref:DUF3504 domain-containing protein n=1 Tax=Pinctada imbricata TaxID=66713 RepID=A0AA88Y2Y1_PINIB|nr:hypothetical protein FSP39_017185 [Pinctada imbricata]